METATARSTITCPACQGRSAETMPLDACKFFYLCPHCGSTLRPKEGDCCVYCSYGSVVCPPVQAQQGACCQDAVALSPS
jgi:phage terminase large subunit GpA-like protein